MTSVPVLLHVLDTPAQAWSKVDGPEVISLLSFSRRNQNIAKSDC